MDWKTFIVEVAKAFAWPGTVLVLLFALRKTITQKLGDLIEIIREGKSITARFAQPQQSGAALPSPGQTILSQEEVREALKKVQYLNADEVDREYISAHVEFIRRGIVTKQQLDQLISSEIILSTLKQIYIEELGRSLKHPLDPMAVAVYGPILYGRALDQSTVDFIRHDVRNSPEYKKRRTT
jgi:DNA-directed RNA polymerase subunit H (RpoH/RPB5)